MSFSANQVAFEVQKLEEHMTTGKVSHKIIMYSKHFYDLKWELSFFGVMWHVISDWLPGYRYCVLLIMECCKRTWEEERSPGKRLQGRDRKKIPAPGSRQQTKEVTWGGSRGIWPPEHLEHLMSWVLQVPLLLQRWLRKQGHGLGCKVMVKERYP